METLPNTIIKSSDDAGRVSNTNDVRDYTYTYTYHRHDVISSHLQEKAHEIPPTDSCRFLLSKGKNGKKRNLALETVIIPSQPNHDPSSDRIIVQYPHGATYNLRKSFLFPIIQQKYQIVVSPETDIYRRLCRVHTRPNDSFVEIGCDFGFTSGTVVCDSRLGIDKSHVSIGIAKTNFPNDDFLEVDVLEISQDEMEDILVKRKLRCCDVDGGLVVAIDINGNRALEAVEACLERVLKLWNPRLVVVKSRSLYSKLVDLKV
eukprot:scaffold2787_cov211-Chaetoceros_neogracile.AAC.8